jgi:acyl-CoA synthetase (AMP-forming)/AMP-acid ligase II
MYGMTECKRITVAEPDEHLRYPGTAGRALTGTTMRVTDPDGADLPVGVTGEVRVRGPHVMDGYWQAPQETAIRFRCPPGTGSGTGSELCTGDFGYLDDDGRLYLLGRRDDIFKRRGIRMNAFEIEEVIRDIPGTWDAIVVPPDNGGELVALVVGRLTPGEVLTGLAERIDAVRVPDRCVVVDTLPSTANGKLDRRAARNLVAGR